MTAAAVTACSAAAPSTAPQSSPASEAAVTGAPAAGGEAAALPAHIAVATAVQAARATPSGKWELTAAAEFLGGRVRQAYRATRAFDRSLDRAALEVEFDVTAAEDGGPQGSVPDSFRGLVTEAVRDRDRVLVRLAGEMSPDQAWYEMGDVGLADLVAWSLLAVDPLGDRIPLLGMIDAGGVEVGAAIVASDGRLTYPIRVPGDLVVAGLGEDAPALAAFLPEDPAADVVDTAVPGSVVLEPSGELVSVELDLDALFMRLATIATDPDEAAYFASADLTLATTLTAGPAEIVVPPQSQVVQPAPILEESFAHELVVGDCLPPGTDLTARVLPLVSCDDAHTFEVFLVDTAGGPGDPYPGRSEIRARTDALCIEAFAGYVGQSFDQSIHALATITPLPDGWASGDRAVVCLSESYLPRRGTLAESQA